MERSNKPPWSAPARHGASTSRRTRDKTGAVKYGGKNVLVTGADGFIGSHLCEGLLAEGAHVTALALYNAFDRIGWLEDLAPATASEIKVVRGDVRDGAQMDRLVEGQDIVFHLAALISIPYSYGAVHSYTDVNVRGTANLLEAARRHAIPRFVHTSTSEVYGTAQTPLIEESHPLVAQSPYAASKIAADKFAEAYALSFDLPVAVLRPFNAFGPRQSERAVIASVIRQALDPACDRIEVGDISPVRDFNYVSDTVAAFLAFGQCQTVTFGRPYNAGGGIGIRIADMIESVRKATGCNKPVVADQKRFRPDQSEVHALIADSRALREATGWRPCCDFATGIAKTCDWWRARLAAGKQRPGIDYIL